MILHFFCQESSFYTATRQRVRIPFALDYYLVESNYVPEEFLSASGKLRDAFPQTTYGICIRKVNSENSSQSIVEEAIVRDITSDRDYVEIMLAVFSRNLVTPCGLIDVVEDGLCSEKFYKKDDCTDTEYPFRERIGA